MQLLVPRGAIPGLISAVVVQKLQQWTVSTLFDLLLLLWLFSGPVPRSGGIQQLQILRCWLNHRHQNADRRKFLHRMRCGQVLNCVQRGCLHRLSCWPIRRGARLGQHDNDEAAQVHVLVPRARGRAQAIEGRAAGCQGRRRAPRAATAPLSRGTISTSGSSAGATAASLTLGERTAPVPRLAGPSLSLELLR